MGCISGCAAVPETLNTGILYTALVFELTERSDDDLICLFFLIRTPPWAPKARVTDIAAGIFAGLALSS